MSKYINHFVSRLVLAYAKLDTVSGCYTLKMSDISHYDLQELAGLLLADSKQSASEATGPDNLLFNDKMLPALIKLLSNSTNRDNQIDFVEAWRDGVTNYMSDVMQQLLADKLDEYNAEHGYTNAANETYPNYIFC